MHLAFVSNKVPDAQQYESLYGLVISSFLSELGDLSDDTDLELAIYMQCAETSSKRTHVTQLSDSRVAHEFRPYTSTL